MNILNQTNEQPNSQKPEEPFSEKTFKNAASSDTDAWAEPNPVPIHSGGRGPCIFSGILTLAISLFGLLMLLARMKEASAAGILWAPSFCCSRWGWDSHLFFAARRRCRILSVRPL